MSELTTTNSSMQASKRKAEQQLATLQVTCHIAASQICVCVCVCMYVHLCVCACVCVVVDWIGYTYLLHCSMCACEQEESEDMDTEMRETADKLRKAMEQLARMQSDYMVAKDQVSSLEKAKVCCASETEGIIQTS